MLISFHLGKINFSKHGIHYLAYYRRYFNPFRLLEQNTTDQVACKQREFFSHSSGGCKSETGMPGWSGEGLLPVDFLYLPQVEGTGNSLWSLVL